jgi:hypothetical protein
MGKLVVRVVAATVAAALGAGCASSTLIRSQPPGAKIYLDGALVGQTPYEMRDTKIVGSVTQVKLRLDGFEESNVLITRSERFDAGACLGGVLVLVPFLWIQGYNPEHVYELTPLRYPPQGYPQQGYPPPQGYPQAPAYPGYPPPAYPYPQQPPPGYPPPPQGAVAPPPAGAPPAQVAPPPPSAAPPPYRAPDLAPTPNPAPSQDAPR